MGLRKYTVAEFRKNIREAFNAIDNGNSVYITRHGVRYEVRKADVQPGKKQIADMNAKIETFPTNGDPAAQIESINDIVPITAPGFKNVGVRPDGSIAPLKHDETSTIAPEKNIAEANASGVITRKEQLEAEIAEKQAELDKIDINTQDFDEIERGSQLAADLDTLRRELERL